MNITYIAYVRYEMHESRLRWRNRWTSWLSAPASPAWSPRVTWFGAGPRCWCSKLGYFGPQAREPIAYIERDWAEEEFSRGCYGAFTTPGTLTRFGPALRAPVGPLHWAGTDTATKWAGYIDGAIESCNRVAREIARALD